MALAARLRSTRRHQSEKKIHFHQVNRKTGNRIQYRKVDSDTGREVDRADIIKRGTRAITFPSSRKS